MIELISYGGKTISVDIVSDFSPEHTAELTEHVIEDGSNINDHKVFKPDVLTFEIAMTEVPIDAPGYTKQPVPIEVEQVRTRVLSPFLLAGSAIRSALGLFGGSVSSFVGYRNPLPQARGNAVYDDLLDLYRSDDLATVTYRGRTYANLSLIGIKTLYSGPPMVGLTKIQVTFRELRTVRLAALGAGLLPNPASLRLALPKQAGIKSPKQIEKEAIPKSVIAMALDAV